MWVELENGSCRWFDGIGILHRQRSNQSFSSLVAVFVLGLFIAFALSRMLYRQQTISSFLLAF